jgi:hypothetical protein
LNWAAKFFADSLMLEMRAKPTQARASTIRGIAEWALTD